MPSTRNTSTSSTSRISNESHRLELRLAWAREDGETAGMSDIFRPDFFYSPQWFGGCAALLTIFLVMMINSINECENTNDGLDCIVLWLEAVISFCWLLWDLSNLAVALLL